MKIVRYCKENNFIKTKKNLKGVGHGPGFRHWLKPYVASDTEKWFVSMVCLRGYDIQREGFM